MYKQDVRPTIISAVNKLVDFVKPTFGPKGQKVIIQKDISFEALDDGVSIAEKFKIDDEFENSIVQFIKEVAIKTNEKVGDGTTGSLVILQSLINQWKDGEGLDLTKFKEEIAKISKKVKSQEDLEKIAYISFNDKEMAKIIAEMVYKVGTDGMVTVEESDSIQIKTEVLQGMDLDSGYVSVYMSTNDRLEAVREKPYILITDKKLTSLQDVLPIMEKILQNGSKDLVIIADDIDGDVLNTLVINKRQGSFNALGIKAPGFGENKRDILEDLASLTGATMVSESKGLKISEVGLEVLGQAEKVIAKSDQTVILGGSGSVKDRLSLIKNQLETATTEFDRERLKRRIAKLTSGVGVIKVGAPTESEMKYLKHKIEDAVNAARTALKGGYILGAGVGLASVDTGSELLNKAFKAPKELLGSNNTEVIDPTDVIIAQVETAVSIAKVLMNTSGILLKDKND